VIRRILPIALALVILAACTTRPVHARAAATDCTAQVWSDALQQVSSDLDATPPRDADARATLRNLMAHPGSAAKAPILQPILDDIDASQRSAASRLAKNTRAQLPPAPEACHAGSTDATSRLEQIYKSPEFQNLDQEDNGFFQTIGKKVSQFFNWIFSHLGTAGTWILVILIVAALAGLVVWRLLQTGAGRRRQHLTTEPAATTDPDVEWRAAETAAARGEYREAVRRAFRAALLHVAIRGRLEVDASWTNRELLARAGGDAQLLASLAPAAHTFELCWYGSASTGEQTWLIERDRCRTIIALSKKPVSA
jgi:hypothetical protein